MDIKVYLPDDLGKRAKKADIKFSALLRAAVEDELMHQETLANNATDMAKIILDLEDKEGRSYKGRFTGVLLAEDDDFAVYQKEDDTLLVYDKNQGDAYAPVDAHGLYDVDALEDCVSQEVYIETMHAIGKDPIVNI